MIYQAIFCVLCVQSTSAWFFQGYGGYEPEWNGLRSTFGVNPFSSVNFAALPRTVSEAITAGWKPDRSAGACGVSGTYFNGNRYRKDGDPGAMVLFDRNGFVAGIQAGIPKTSTAIYPGPQHRKFGVFNEEASLWVITAYFVEPSMICSTGRTGEQFDMQGTGTMLAIQTGPTPDSVKRAPLDESDVLSQTKFVKGKCFYGMGVHYWYNLTKDMSCDDTFPAFLLYNKGRLTAFGWAFNIYFDNSIRWEHPDRAVFGRFINNVPNCLGVNHTVTTLHMYLTDTPWYNTC